MAGVIRSKTNPVVFFDISIGPTKIGRLKIELFADVAPRTAENFRQMCTGEFLVNGKPTGYKNCIFHKITKDVRVEGGDILHQDGSGSISIYGEHFEDENFLLNHEGPGLLSMSNSGKNRNGCQFFLTCSKCEWLDGKNVVFGKIIDEPSMEVLRKIEATPVVAQTWRSKLPVMITECGEL